MPKDLDVVNVIEVVDSDSEYNFPNKHGKIKVMATITNNCCSFSYNNFPFLMFL